MKPPRTAIIGGHGQLGRVLTDAYRKFYPDTIATDWKGRDGLTSLDLAQPDARTLRLKEAGYAWAVIAASVRYYEICERQPEFTRQRNVTGTLRLTEQLLEQGTKVVFLSTDAVFDGESGGYSEEDPVHPINEYGRQKAEVERELLKMAGRQCLIIRISRVIGVKKGDGTLLDEIADSLTKGRPVMAARDQRFSSLFMDDLPPVLMALQAKNADGIIHVVGPEALSRLEIALTLAKGLEADPKLIRDISLDDIKDGVPRQKNLALKCDRLNSLLNYPITSITTCIGRVVANYREAPKEARFG